MQTRPDRLDVYYGSDLVGAVHETARRWPSSTHPAG
jgi:hypothetical protein